MFKKSTSTSRICENRLTPIQWDSVIRHGDQYVTPPKKSKVVVYSTKSHGRKENFEIYDRTYNRAIKKLWVKLVIEIGQGRSVKSLNEWEKMLIQKFGKLNYEKA
jgi:16S rRNA C967 or C1407 C5-methylase (RsmB/RsmF family)